MLYSSLFIFLSLFSTEGEEQASQPPASGILFVVRSTTLFVVSTDGRIASTICIPARSFVRGASPSVESPRGLDSYVFVTAYSGGAVSTGWIWSGSIVDLGTIKPMPDRGRKQTSSRDVPELIRSQPERIQKAWNEVNSAVDESKKLRKELPEPYLARASIWAEAGNFDSALQDYLKAADIVLEAGQEPGKASRYFATFQRALQRLDLKQKGSNESDARDHYNKGRSAASARELEVALEHFDNAVQIAPGEPLHWYYRALTHKLRGDERRAIHDVRIGVFLESSPPMSAKYIGQVPEHLETVQGPLRYWLDGFRDADPASRYLGLENQRRPKNQPTPVNDVAEHVREILADFASRNKVPLSADPMPANLPLQSVAFQRSWDEVSAAIADGKKLKKEVPEPYFVRASLWALADEHEPALQDYLVAVKLAISENQDLNKYAKYFALLRESLDKIDRMPRPPSAGSANKLFAKGRAALRRGEAAAALSYFDAAVQLAPIEPLYRYFRGLAHRELGNHRQARDEVLIAAHLETRDGHASPLSSSEVVEQMETVQGKPREWLEKALKDGGHR